MNKETLENLAFIGVLGATLGSLVIQGHYGQAFSGSGLLTLISGVFAYHFGIVQGGFFTNTLQSRGQMVLDNQTGELQMVSKAPVLKGVDAAAKP